MKNIFTPLFLILLITIFSNKSFAQTGPPTPPDPDSNDTENALFDNDPIPEFGSVTFSPSPMTDTEVTGNNTISASISDDGEVISALVLYGTTSGDLTKSFALSYSSGTTWKADLPVLEDGTYYYQIKAADNSQQEVVSTEASFEITAGTPVAPADLQASAIDYNRFTLEWQPSYQATSYYLIISTEEDYSNPIVDGDIGNVTSYEATSVQFSTTYYYQLKAIRLMDDDAVMESEISSGEVTTLDQPAPEVTVSVESLPDFGDVVSGENSATSSYTVTAQYLRDNLVVTPPTGFEVSTDETNWQGNASPLSLAGTDGELSTTIYVRFAPDTPGATSGDITHETTELPETVLVALSGTALETEPANHVSNFRLAGQNGNTFHLSWDENNGEEAAEGYLLLFTQTTVQTPVDGETPIEDIDFSDGEALIVIDKDTTAAEVYIPGSETRWYTQIIPYRGSDETTNVKTDGTVPEITLITPLDDLPNAWINEFHYSDDGDDHAQVEIVLENADNYSLEDFILIHYNGAGGTIIDEFNFADNASVSVQGAFSIILIDCGTLQKGPDGLAISYQHRIVQFISYEDSFIATEGDATGITSIEIAPQETTTTPPNFSIQLTGSGSYYEDFTWQDPAESSFGAVNAGQILTASPNLETTWLGTQDNDWNNAANWNNGVPDETMKGIIPAGVDHYPVLTAGVTPKTLVLESDASLSGQQYLPESCILYAKRALTAEKWLFLTPPVEDNIAAMFEPVYGMVYLITYDNSQAADESAWNYVSDQTLPLSPMTGYGFYSTREELELVFNGSPISGTQSVLLSFEDAGNNFNFVGNPGLGAIDWSTSNQANTTGTAYMFDPNAKTYLTIASDGTVTNPEFTDMIPPMQGFFVEATNAGNYSVNLDDCVPTDQYFLKQGVPEDYIVRLKVTGPNGHDFALVRFDQTNNDELDFNEDSRKLVYYDIGVPQLWFSQEGEKLAINQARTYPASFPLGLYISDDSELSITGTVSGSFSDGITMSLENTITGETLDLRSSDTLRYDASAGENNSLILHLKNGTGFDEFTNEKVRIYSSGEILHVTASQILKGKLEVFNFIGQKITEYSINHTNHARVQPGTGIYLVRWTDDEQAVVQKVSLR
ncbi:hypothetical protein [Prolixibacter denitrificans]|uniref:Fibronectin type-III domain-containing protein n=1 Tax=Prolixibacter denitrificans TaxID=1541063 RepID=A0A2P8CFU2_9BACT|nr:hypothetical protein [Prolixibacter denitrificans]PSK83792.1 hypothetical protein CLV93_103208 [Prolixibacter denitrificans]GET23334.1 hypothetical protein JCM18694_35800 [Prolixibacter denitrificans]